MIKRRYLIGSLFGINLLMAGLLHGWIYDVLDTYLYEQKEQLYQRALKDSRETLGAAAPDQWNVLGDALGVKYTTGSMIYTRDSKELPSKVLDYISDTIASTGVVDPFTPDIYYPLGDNHVFVLGPLALRSWQQYAIEWVTFLASMLGSSLIILAYWGFISKHSSRIYARLNQLRATVNDTSTTIDLHHNEPLEYIYPLIEQIKQEQLQLQQSNQLHIQSQRDLLHGVAHEFRSPMARMQFALEMLDEGNANEQAQMVAKLNQGIEELDELVKELLSYSRIKHLNNQLQLSEIAVSQLIEESIDKVASFYPAVQFEYTHSDLQILQGDERLLQRALANVLRNAGRFSHTRCRVSVRQKLNMWIQIIVDDDGGGIAPGKRKRIFEPFTRLDPSRSRDSGGSGLGLAIVQSILEQHRGYVEVDDSELGGASFIITLPIKIIK